MSAVSLLFPLVEIEALYFYTVLMNEIRKLTSNQIMGRVKDKKLPFFFLGGGAEGRYLLREIF